ncbi:N-6 DNA methylase [Streptacidiphilus sp. N1-10]|uniref:N-6 DNA methylase n=1 Tax=Streptacidiphilus jeojiensis TaxID=3229225 RepID=A0ABV6XVL5_9ACTN
MPDQEHRAQVSAVEIARLAGVGRAAVSNWRRRHADFPRPVGGTESSPAFSLAEVEGWLRSQGKIVELPLRERVRGRIELLRDPAGSPAAPLVPALALLLLLQRDPAARQLPAPGDDLRVAAELPAALQEQAVRTLGTEGARLLRLPALLGSTQVELCRLLAELAEERGIAHTASELVGALGETAGRQGANVPAPLAGLLAELARAAGGGTGAYLDPACGNGALLLEAARRGATALHGQEADQDLAAVALLRLALDAPADRPVPLPFTVAAGDALRADAGPELRADAVLSRPPFNERNWGAEELGYDPRWEYGLPARAESELAWVQHALARVRAGGPAVLLLPGAVAARRSGRRIRAELLRRGALRAVAALPVGIAAPYAAALHIWVLRRPVPGEPPPVRVLLVDAGGGSASGSGALDGVLEAWTAFDGAADADPVEQPGRYRAVPIVDLLDDETDLTPARHLPQRPADAHRTLTEAQQQLDGLLDALTPLRGSLPGHRPGADDGSHRAAPTIAELIRAGAVELPPEGEPPQPGDVVVLLGAGGRVDVQEEPVGESAGGRAIAEATAPALLLRPDPTVLDPWFLAGFVEATVRSERAGGGTAVSSSFTAGAGSTTSSAALPAGSSSTLSAAASAATRRDVRRTRVPRLPLAEQASYARPFRQLAVFRRNLLEAADLGDRLTLGILSGLVDGSLAPEQ